MAAVAYWMMRHPCRALKTIFIAKYSRWTQDHRIRHVPEFLPRGLRACVFTFTFGVSTDGGHLDLAQPYRRGNPCNYVPRHPACTAPQAMMLADLVNTPTQFLLHLVVHHRPDRLVILNVAKRRLYLPDSVGFTNIPSLGLRTATRTASHPLAPS
jgi:hypothetical protein